VTNHMRLVSGDKLLHSSHKSPVTVFYSLSTIFDAQRQTHHSFSMAVTEFQEALDDPAPFSSETNTSKRVYALLCQIPKGKVSSYACLSKALSSSPRAVGGALRRNPFAPEVPCHRIINASGVRAPVLWELLLLFIAD
jgi:O-6-methylguanine DNA methyltransferase